MKATIVPQTLAAAGNRKKENVQMKHKMRFADRQGEKLCTPPAWQGQHKNNWAEISKGRLARAGEFKTMSLLV